MKKFSAQRITLTSEQKERFQKRMTNQMRQYLWIPLCLLLLFQLYNMGYVLYYTNFALASIPSKVYFALYMSMFLALAITGFLVYLIPTKSSSQSGLRNVWFLAVFILLWALCITVYDQRTSDNVAVYTQMIISVAVLIYMPPKIFLPLFLTSEMLFIIFLPLFQTGEFGDNYGVYLNSVWTILIAIFICYYHYFTALRAFKKDLVIEENTALLVKTNEKLDNLAKKDQLTQVYNRRHLAWYLESLCQKSESSAVQFYMIDIDDFKLYNDHFGHVNGDLCLQKVASALQNAFQSGYLFRFGGEEFLGVLDGLEPNFDFGASLCPLIENLGLSSALPGKHVTVSIGFSSGTVKEEADWEKLLRNADQALYAAKKNGKNQIVYG